MSRVVLGLILVGVIPLSASAFADRIADPGVEVESHRHNPHPGTPKLGPKELPYEPGQIKPGGPLYLGPETVMRADGVAAWENVRAILANQFQNSRSPARFKAGIIRTCGNNAYDAESCLRKVGYCEVEKRFLTPQSLPVGAVVTYDQRPLGNVFVKSSKYTWTSAKTYTALPPSRPWSRLTGVFIPCSRKRVL